MDYSRHRIPSVQATFRENFNSMTSKFSFQPVLSSKTISIRPVIESDYDGLYACASDKKLWEGHPAKDRYKAAEFKTWFKNALDSHATIVVIDNFTDKLIGSSRFYIEDSASDDIAIGFTFIARQYWGGKTNVELKSLMLNYAFDYFSVVWFHVSPTNIRSQKATEKIGALFTHQSDSTISGKSEPWMFYKIEKSDWLSLVKTEN